MLRDAVARSSSRQPRKKPVEPNMQNPKCIAPPSVHWMPTTSRPVLNWGYRKAGSATKPRLCSELVIQNLLIFHNALKMRILR